MNLQVPFNFCMKISESSKIAASLRDLKNYGGLCEQPVTYDCK